MTDVEIAAPKYNKIQNLFKRSPETHGIAPYLFGNEAIEFLLNAQWIVQEKIDGTNTRIIWDGNRVTFGSKNTLDTSNLQGKLRVFLEENYGTPEFEQIIEQKFGDTPITIYGEGYGHKIQNGGEYFPESNEGKNEFVGFDVRVEGHYVSADDTRAILSDLGIPIVNSLEGTQTIPNVISDMLLAIDLADEGEPAILHDHVGNKEIEGYVLRTAYPLYDHRGNRVMTKIILDDVRYISENFQNDISEWFGVEYNG